MGMTIAEKILARQGGRNVVVPGDIVTVEVDTTTSSRSVSRNDVRHTVSASLRLCAAAGFRWMIKKSGLRELWPVRDILAGELGLEPSKQG